MMTVTENTLNESVRKLATLLTKLKLRLATAESCTGGWIAKTCTDIAGSSNWFDCGFVCYSNHSKQMLLNVSTETLAQHGAVSQQTAEQMALGALKHSTADISVAVTGIAGPGGGSAGKPVGIVWITWACAKSDAVTSQCFHFDGDREAIRRQTVYQALTGLIDNSAN